MQFPKCKVCGTRRHTKRVRDDYFRCTECGSIWKSSGFSEQERREQSCPICDIYVEYANWQPYFPYGYYSPWDKQVLKNFHHECYEKYAADIAGQQREFEEQVARAEAISKLTCPGCDTQSICEEEDNFYYCMQCDTEFTEEWINEKLKEAADVLIKKG